MIRRSIQVLLAVFTLAFSVLNYAKPQTLDAVVAVANDDVITQAQLARQVALIKQNLTQQHTPLPAENVLRKQVLEHMISLSLQKQLAEKYGMKVTDAEIDSAIQNIAEGQHMTMDQLRAAVAADGLDYNTFRQQIADQMLVQRVQQAALHDKIRITDQELDDYMRVLKSQPSQPSAYHIQDILIALPDSPTSEQVQAAKQRAETIVQKLKQGASFDQLAVAESAGEEALQRGDLGWRRLPELPAIFAEQVRDSHKGDILGPIRADNGFHILKIADMRGDSQAAHYSTEARVRQIYLKADPNYPAKVYQEKLAKLRNEILHGTDFAQLAETYSDDPVTASKGGDMGWIKPNSVSPAFAQAIDSTATGKVSQPFATPAGWHLVQVLERKKVEDTAEYRRDQIKAMIYQRKFSEQLQSWLQQLRSSTYVKIMDPALADAKTEE